jgi:hypothetical protein
MNQLHSIWFCNPDAQDGYRPGRKIVPETVEMHLADGWKLKPPEKVLFFSSSSLLKLVISKATLTPDKETNIKGV